ncbi:MAG: NUDIX domain-containing protein [Sedimentisphaerales bacterium]|nr:NUDIX domain-containing protein [Sedimentisphaerales bacterium]
MKILRIDRDIAWLPQPNEAHYILDDALPPLDLTTTAFALAFDGDRFLMTRLAHRGWDIPGGHLEPGETPLETARRETYEETRARLGELWPFGYQKIVIDAPKPEGYPYPHPVAYQVFFLATVVRLDPFVVTEEAVERGLFSPAEAQAVDWIQRYRELYDAALAAAGQGKV